jgi:HK97 family phage major capsid protein
MGAYLDRLNAQFDEITNGITSLIDRAATEDRDVSEAEQAQVDRDRSRLEELQTAIGHYSELETRAAKVGELRRSLPVPPAAPRSTGGPAPEEYDVAREFPTPGDYAITVHRALMLRDPVAREALERATAHQTTADNPGIIPRPVLGPVLNFLNATRPFVNSCTRRPLPAGKFDRPKISQHVAVGVQAGEKTLTESQKIIIGSIPTTAKTFAGHLNISRQDIKWTSPAILNIVFDDFAAMYALATCEDAAAEFLATAGGPNPDVPIPTWDFAGINEALYTAAATAMAAGGALADTMYASPDVWGRLGGLTNTQSGAPAFPGMSVSGAAGSPLGLNMVVDEHFPANTLITGPARFTEWYEDVDGLLQVGEPDVLGQLVGYAGYGAFVNVNPEAFTVFTVPAPV